jgi:DNA repair protein RadC
MPKEKVNENGIHDGHRDRMRERFRKNGFESMHPHEMLEMLLFYSVPRRDTNELAHRLIDTFGSLSGVFEASEEQLTSVKGITPSSATLIKMILPFAREYKCEVADAKRLKNSQECGEFLKDYYSGMMQERVTALCLDSGCRVLGFETVCDGDVSNVVINFRKLVEIIMKYPLTTAVIISHNHPGGIALPSREDIAATTNLRNTLTAMNIGLVDHIIVSDNDYVSMSSSPGFGNVFK